MRADRRTGGQTLAEPIRAAFLRASSRLWPNAVEGHVDIVENGVVHGWAKLQDQPHERVLVDLFVDGVFAGERLANIPRDDLRLAGIGDGCYGFELDLKETPFDGRAVCVEAFVLAGARTALRSGLAPAAPLAPRALRPGMIGYLRSTFARFLTDAPIDASPAPGPREKAGRRLYERLFDPTPAPREPVGVGAPVGAYLDLTQKRAQAAFRFEPGLATAQYASFLEWYLTAYGKRRGRKRAPLGRSDIAFLNRPDDRPARAGDQAPGHGAADISLARALFAARFAPQSPKILEDGGPACAFTWCADNAAVMSVEDCLIAPTDRATLGAIVDGQDNQPLPLSRFMALWFARHPILCEAPVGTAQGRAFAYFAFLLFAATAPHLLQFVPAQGLRAFLSPDSSGRSPFDTQSELIFPQIERCADAWRARVRALDFDIEAGAFATLADDGSRLFAAARPLAQAALVDVQVIGPFTRALGVGESCRRLADALQRLDYSVRFCDFALDHPNLDHAGNSLELQPIGRARVNILHVNLENVPKVIAYCPDAFTGAYNIAFPYLEVQPLLDIHRPGAALVDEAWAASGFIQKTLAPFVRTTQVGGAVNAVEPTGRDAARARIFKGAPGPDTFVFLTASDALSGAYRKNPLAAVRAFLCGFPDNPDVCLIVKTHSIDKVVSEDERAVWRAIRDVSAQDPRIRIIDSLLDADANRALIEGADCFVSLHRAEGLGYLVLEAMQLGVPVIASDYSGTTDFCTPDTAHLVACKRVHVDPRCYPDAGPEQVWGDPDHDGAVAAMRAVYEERHGDRPRIAQARALVDANYTSAAFARRVDGRLKELLGAR